MENFTVNTICDKDGFKQVFTSNGISKVWYFQWYDFEREIKQVSHVEVFEVKADGFNHAKDILSFQTYRSKSVSDTKNLFKRINSLELRILQKFGKKLKGKADRSKINSFLR